MTRTIPSPFRFRTARMTLSVASALLLQLGLAACGGEGEPAEQTDQTEQSDQSDQADQSDPEQDASDALAADNGFRPEPHGFSFPNYGDEYPDGDLTVAQARRMFGDSVCRTVDAKGCRPSLATKMWIKSANQAMSGGHCEGMAVLSALVFKGEEDVKRLGGQDGSDTYDLSLDGNIALQREIGYYWATQAVPSVQDATLSGTPAEVFDSLRQGLESGEEQYTIGIYNRQGEGHAVTPFAVTDVDANGEARILVYDNNFPGEEKYISVDPEADTWTYATAALNPAEDAEPWEGDAETQSLDITPLSSRVGRLDCPYCGDSQGAGDEIDKGRTMVRLQGAGSLYVQDGAGHRTGQVDGKLVNEIPGARIAAQAGAVRLGAAPLIILPSALDFEAFASGKGAGAKDASLSIIRGGMVLLVDKMALSSAQNRLRVGATGLDITYVAGAAQQPRIEAAVDGAGAGRDYSLAIGGADTAAGEEISVRFDPETEELDLSGSDSGAASFDLELEAQDDEGDSSFAANDLSLDGGTAAIFDLTDWDEGEDLAIGLDQDGDDQADSELNLDDAPQSELFDPQELAEETDWWADDEADGAGAAGDAADDAGAAGDAPADGAGDASADDEAAPPEADDGDGDDAGAPATSP